MTRVWRIRWLSGSSGAMARPARLLADAHQVVRKDLPALGGKGVEARMPPAPAKPAATVGSVRRGDRWRAGEPIVLRAWRTCIASETGQAVPHRRMRVEGVDGLIKQQELGVALRSAGLTRLTRRHCRTRRRTIHGAVIGSPA